MTRSLLVAATVLATAPASAESLLVRVENVEGTAGELRVAVCQRSFDESGCRVGAWRSAAGRHDFRFDDLSPGRYAVAVYHDLNGNGELDRMPPGLPTEPYGFSNEVGRFGPPSFERALVPVNGAATEIVVSLGRLFDGG